MTRAPIPANADARLHSSRQQLLLGQTRAIKIETTTVRIIVGGPNV